MEDGDEERVWFTRQSEVVDSVALVIVFAVSLTLIAQLLCSSLLALGVGFVTGEQLLLPD